MAAGPIAERAGKLPGLTHALTSFVGRSSAIDRVSAMLAEYRLVTITGPGGVGKTRLADEVLKRVASRFADGVWVVELTAIQDPALVPGAVATTFGLRQAAGVSVTDALTARLSRQQLLLVLDNCEHVLDSVAQFCANILLAADDIRILATSREPLGLPEEARYRLPPLALPDSDARGHAVQVEAVTLFAERARQVDPDFALDNDTSAMVERLVRRLDGIPLAIELAAARVEALALAQLVDRLDDRFRLLVSTNRAAVARQRSLEAAVDWSYQLLSASEQRVFRFLSVFPGPFTLDAAEAVAGTDAGAAVLRLVDCSLLVPPRTGPDGRSRYSILETLRGYGAGRLRQAGEDSNAAAALAAYALEVAEQATEQLSDHDQELSAALWLDAEDAAVHQGLAWALQHEPSAALRLAVALAPWWLLRGRWVEGYASLKRAVTQTNAVARDWYSGCVWLGELARGTGDFSIVLGHFNTVVDKLQDSPPSPELVEALTGRCSALRNVGRLEDAAADARTALDLARQLRYPSGEASAFRELSFVSIYDGQSEKAVEWARQIHGLDSNLIPAWRARRARAVLMFALVLGGRADEAEAQCGQVLAQARIAGDLGEQADTLHLLAILASRTGRLADARRHLREAAKIAADIAYPLRLLDVLDEVGYVCAATGRHAEAVTLWSAMFVQNEATGLADTPADHHRRESPLRQAEQALGQRLFKTAQERGAAMTLAAAVEFAVMMTEEEDPQAEGSAPPAKPGLLSARERELVALVAQGRTDAEIAEQLFISVSTVRTHLDRIRDKSGFRRRADLTRLAL
ncbi:MAG TPA: LuxR C-terminal-related transcriptional regulator, partial [Streptosporangiaceae bacterium]|nr:LuxR C-terminal-related transcriptional regulator [Streptosporangiaceae bacterium]